MNLAERVLEIRRTPGASPNGPAYTEQWTVADGDRVTPVTRPDVTIAIADLLP